MSAVLPKQKKLVSISQAAKLLGVSIDTIRRWDNSGVLHSVRLDGKNRYFTLEELANHKSGKPLSISEASRKLGISPTTLRRLEKRGLLVPKRNHAKERVYTKTSLDAFLKSGYFAGKKALKSKEKYSSDEYIIEKPVKTEVTKPSSQKNESYSSPFLQNQFLQGVLHKAPEMLALTVIFGLLIAIGVTNITLASTEKIKAHTAQTKALLSGITLIDDNPSILTPKELEDLEKTQEKEKAPDAGTLEYMQTLIEGALDYKEATESTKAAQVKREEGAAGPDFITPASTSAFLSINTLGADSISIREKPSTESATIGKALDGQIFQMISADSSWYRIRFYEAEGFISEKFAEIKEIQ